MIDEGYIKFDIAWSESGPLEFAEIDELNAWRGRLYEAGLVGCYDDLGIGYGNVSVRIGGSDLFVISGTRTGQIARTGREHYALVTAFDVERNRVVCQGPLEASSESMTHAAIYAHAPAIGAIAHVHDEELWRRSLGDIPTAGAGVAYGTPELATEVERLLGTTSFVIDGVAALAGHESGLISVGADIAEASSRILSLKEQMLAG